MIVTIDSLSEHEQATVLVVHSISQRELLHRHASWLLALASFLAKYPKQCV